MSSKLCKADFDMLEKAFEKDIYGGLNRCPRIFQTRAVKRAEGLVAKGLLAPAKVVFIGVTITGYEITHAGIMCYTENLP